MGKIVKLFIFLLLSCTILWGAVPYTKQLEQYDVQMKNASNDELLRIFHGLKSIYIQSIISGDDVLKKETLTRLIKSAKQLNLDASKYESELKTLQRVQPSVKKEEKNIPPLEPSSNAPSKEQSFEPKSSVNIPSSYKGKNVFHSGTSTKEMIVLNFGSPVDQKNVKVFGLNSSNSYKKVIDIPAVILGTPPTLKSVAPIQSTRLTQYSADTIRLVLDAPKVFDTYVSVVDEKVFISFTKQPPILPTPMPKEAKSAPSFPSPPPTIPLLTKAEASNVPSKAQRSRTIVIDAGHGGKDAGAIGYKGRMEKHLVLDVALELGKMLKQRGHKVYYTRTKDEFINLRDRTKVANDKNADLFISLHANAAPNEAKKLSMKGLETFFLSPDRSERSKNVAALENQSDIEEMDFYSKETFLNVLNREKIVLSNKAAIDVQSHMLKNVLKKYDVDDGGVREAPFWVLVGALMPSVLVELGYITNPDESDKMFNPHYQKLLVEGMSDGVERYFSNNP